MAGGSASQKDSQWGWKEVAIVVGGVAAAGTLVFFATQSGGKPKKEKKKKKTKAKESTLKEESSSSSSSLPPSSASSSPSAATVAAAPAAAAPAVIMKKEGTKEVTREGVIQVFGDILFGMEGTIVDLAMYEKSMKEAGEAQEVIESNIAQTYVNAITQLQLQCFQSHGVTEQEVDRAVEANQNDPEFKKITDRMQFLNRTLLGGPPELAPEQLDQVPDWLTVDKLIELLTKMMKGIDDAFDKSLVAVREKHPTGELPEQEVQEHNIALGRLARMEVLKEYDLTEETLNIVLFKHSNEPKLQEVMMNLQKKHTDRRTQKRQEELELSG